MEELYTIAVSLGKLYNRGFSLPRGYPKSSSKKLKKGERTVGIWQTFLIPATLSLYNVTTESTLLLSKYTIDKSPTMHFCGDSVASEIYTSLMCFYPCLTYDITALSEK